ncbi:binding--dependent transport system inner membrane component family protein [Ralstonia pickettii]|nr:binding--dependent transport system inner membrane component family protein [Ralstonia pickettii]
MLAPAVALFCAFWLLPMAALLRVSGSEGVIATYTAALTTSRYLGSLFSTVVLSAAVTLATLVLSTIAGLFLVRRNVPGKRMITAMLTFPLAFPGVVVGFMVILLAGRQGLLGDVTHKLIGEKWVFAYSIGGLFLGYLYFSIPRVVLTVMAAAEKLDRSLEEAARSLGASSWQVTRDVLVPGLAPALIASGAICFATSMGAFGTAFTLATDIDVLPMTIYTEFTLNAGIAMAAALSVVLGVVTWLVLAIARTASGSPSGAAA